MENNNMQNEHDNRDENNRNDGRFTDGGGTERPAYGAGRAQAEGETEGGEAEEELLKTVPSILENKFADFTYKFAKYIPETVLPNRITTIGFFGGLAGALSFFLGSFSRWFFILAIAGTITHIVSDNLDGYIARERRQTSACGAYYDLMSDILFSTFVILFIGISGFTHVVIAAFCAPLYGVHMVSTLHYIMHYNEFPFPGFGPFEIHCTYIGIALINMIFGPVVLFTVWGVSIMPVDIILLVTGIGGYKEVIRMSLGIFRKLRDDRR